MGTDDGRASRRTSCSTNRLSLIAVGLIVLLVLAFDPSPSDGVPEPSASSPRRAISELMNEEAGDGLPDGRCLITRWDAVWRVHEDNTRSWIQYPGPGCIGRAKTVSDLSPFPQSKTKTLDREASKEACTLSCSLAVTHEPGGLAQVASAAVEGVSSPATAAASARPPVASEARTATGLSAEALAWAPTRAPSVASGKARTDLEGMGLLAMGGGEGDAFLLGVNKANAAIESISPVSVPTLSYALPAKDRTQVHWAGSGRVPLPIDRTLPGFHHLGDATLRVRRKGETRWASYSTVVRGPWTTPACGQEPDASKRPKVETDASGRAHSADVSGCLTPSGSPVTLARKVKVDANEALIEWTITNVHSAEVTVGGFGVSMPFNQMFTGRSLPDVSARCSFTEPYVGGGAGYVQVTRASGEGPVLLVLLEAPGGGGLEAWRPLQGGDRANYDWMHEMLYEALFHSKAHQDDEWKPRGTPPTAAQPWLPPTEVTLPPGATRTYRARFRLAPNVEAVTAALLAAGRPVAVPLPAASFHLDMRDVRLQLLLPRGLRLASATAAPAAGLVATAQQPPQPLGAPAADGISMQTVGLAAKQPGRLTVALTYAYTYEGANGGGATSGGGGGGGGGGGTLTQWVSLMALEPARTVVERYGRFQSEHAYLNASVADPWHRSPAFFGYDADLGERGALVDEVRVFMAGMSDESGAAAPLSMAVKQLGMPDPAEVAQLEAYVHETLWAGDGGDPRHFLQTKEYAVRASMLFWSDELQASPAAAVAAAPNTARACQKCWPKCYWMHCWSEKRSRESWRAYNYPHVATTYWALYRLGRHFEPPLTRRASWEWYLKQAARTVAAMWKNGGRGGGTSQWGLMVGSAFVLILDDLEREGFDDEAAPVRKMVEQRIAKWSRMSFPYGSEFPWDSTGQEEINTWLLRRGEHAKANMTVGAVLAYASLVPHWAYCGSARRYWDFVINGKTVNGNEREFHHYGSTLNAIPILDHYRAFPGRQHLLRLGGCALLGHLSLHDEKGAASMAWHGDPAFLRRDAYSGDYGVGMYGYWRSAGAYVGCAPPHGWVCVYCELQRRRTGEGGRARQAREEAACEGGLVGKPRDPFGRRVYVAPLGISATVEGAAITTFELSDDHRRLTLTLAPHKQAHSARATLSLTTPRVEPPPPPLSGLVVRCRPQPDNPQPDADCVRRDAAVGSPAGEYVVKMPQPFPLGTTRKVEVQLP